MHQDSKDDQLNYKICTIVEGDITLAIIHKRNISSNSENNFPSDDDFPIFENLREITGSLLVYNVRLVKFIFFSIIY